MNKILIVSTFPPRKCGIGTYAYSQAKYYKDLGYEVITLGLARDSSSYRKLHFNKEGILATSKWLMTQSFDEVHLHFVDGFFNFEKNPALKVGLFKLFSLVSKKFVIVLHEIIPNIKANTTRLVALSFADELEVHTDKEKIAIHSIFKNAKLNVKAYDRKIKVPMRFLSERIMPNISVVEHDRYFCPYFLGSKNEARELLGLDLNKKIIVSLGFIQKHKGFDRVIDAMELLEKNEILYCIVGSRREEAEDIIAYYNYLEGRVNSSLKSIRIVNKFLSDEEFDIWVKAADALVLPYREIWSSGVGARAKLLGCPVIASDLPTLREQLVGQEHYLFSDADVLSEILSNLPKKVDNTTIVIEKLDAFSSNKKILVIAPVLTSKFVGGAEIVIKDLVSILSQSRKYDITVLATQSDSVADFNNKARDTNPREFGWGDNVKIIRFFTISPLKSIHKWAHSRYNQSSGVIMNSIWKYSGLNGVGLINYVKKYIDDYDIVYVPHYLYPISHQLIKIAGKKNIVHPFVHDELALDNINNKKFFQHARSIIVNSDAEKYILDKHNVPVFCSIDEIGNRVDIPTFADDQQKRSRLFEKIGVKPKKYLFYVGRISKMKNVDDLIHWHKAFLEKTALNIDLVIAGKGDPCKVADLDKLPKGIKYAGFLSDEEKNIMMSNALAVTQLSILESFSLVMIESWLSRVPVIVNKNCLPIKYNFIKSQSSGFLVGDESEYIKAIESLIFMPAKKYKEMGKNGYEFASRNFTTEVFNQKLIQQFDKAISEVSKNAK